MNARLVLGFLTLPVRLLHELSHLAVALPWADDWQIVVDADDAAARVSWAEDTPAWGVVLSALAPALLGLGVALSALAFVLSTGRPLPQSLMDALWWTLGVVGWALYTAPSPADCRSAAEVIRDA